MFENFQSAPPSEVVDYICGEIAKGTQLKDILNNDWMPSMRTFFRWLRTYPELAKSYEMAKMERADVMFEEIIEIADDARNDWMIEHDKDGNGFYKFCGEHVARSRLRIDTRKWAMTRLNRFKYGDKLEADVKVHTTLEQLVSKSFEGSTKTDIVPSPFPMGPVTIDGSTGEVTDE